MGSVGSVDSVDAVEAVDAVEGSRPGGEETGAKPRRGGCDTLLPSDQRVAESQRRRVPDVQEDPLTFSPRASLTLYLLRGCDDPSSPTCWPVQGRRRYGT